MAGAYPLTPYFNSAAIEQDQPVIVSRARNRRMKRRKHDGHVWLLTGAYVAHEAADFLPIFAFLCDREGSLNSFTIIPNEHATPRGVASGTPLVNGASQTGKTLNIKGAGTSVTGWLKAGDVLTAAGHTKVYLVTANVDTDGAGNAAIPIVPALVASPSDNAALTLFNVAFTMVLAKNNVKASKVPPVLYSGTVEMEEDI